jgi:hypothetical protein
VLSLCGIVLIVAACTGSPPDGVPSTATPAAASSTALPQSSPTVSVVGSPTAPPCVIEPPWTVELVVSGGFAGIEHKLEIDSSGGYQAEDVQAGTKVEGSLSAEMLAMVEGQLPLVCQPSPGRPPACADCLQYSIEVTSASGNYQVVLNDVSLAQSPMAPLVDTLAQVMKDALGP